MTVIIGLQCQVRDGTRTEPEQNRTQTIRVLSHSTPQHNNGQRNETLLNTKTHFTKWASASHFWKATPSRNYRYGPECLVGVPSCVLCGF